MISYENPSASSLVVIRQSGSHLVVLCTANILEASISARRNDLIMLFYCSQALGASSRLDTLVNIRINECTCLA